MTRIKKIESLTPAQWQDMREYREAQRRDALRTDAIDHDAARDAVRNLYTTAGLEDPKHILILQSPIQCLMARGLFRIGNNDQLWDQLRGQLWDQLGDQLRVQLGDQLGDQLWVQLGDQLGDQLRDQLWDQLWVQLGGRELYQDTWFLGGWDNFWLAFYDFGRRIGVKYQPDTEARLDAYLTYAAKCGIAYLYPQVAFVSDRPAKICFDHQRRLHADDGPALRWRDGYSIYAWRGLRVPDALIEKRLEMTPQQIVAISNAEHRRAAIEIYGHVHGPARFVEDLGAKLIAEDTAQDRPRRLYQVRNERFLHVINGSLESDGTRREFLLGADPEMASPHAAVAASYGRPAGKYREAVRT